MICSDCNSEYTAQRKRPCSDGLFRCKDCSAKRRSRKGQAVYRKKNPEKVKAAYLAWKQSNPEYFEAHKEAYAEYRKAYYAENKEKMLRQCREWRLKNSYGLTPDDIPENCQVCGGTDKICVDHDHKTGKVRGFLCNSCNLVLGFGKDDPALLEKLALYLREHNGCT